jgi:hypothetical protein
MREKFVPGQSQRILLLPEWKKLSSRRKPIERNNDFEIQQTCANRTHLRAAEDEAALHSSALEEREIVQPPTNYGPLLGEPVLLQHFFFCTRRKTIPVDSFSAAQIFLSEND